MMGQSQHRIELTGEFAPGADWKASLESLAALMKLPLPKVRTLLSNSPVVIKRDVDAQTAERYRERIEQTGALCRIVPPIASAEAALDSESPNPMTPTVTSSPEQSPDRTASVMTAMASQADLADVETADNDEGASTLSEYLAPEADAAQAGSQEDASGHEVAVTPKAADIDVDRTFFGRGWGWVAEGCRLFGKSPGMWIGITFAYTLVVIAVNIVPLAGFVGYCLIQPVLWGGVMRGCHALERGESLEMSHLFQGFDTHINELLKLGAIALGGTLVVIMASFVTIIATMGTSVLFSVLGSGGMAGGAVPAGVVPGILVAFLVGQSLWLIVVAMLWFAPALVVLRGVGAWDAAKLSLRGVLRNILPFMLYGVVLLVPVIIATLSLFLGWLILGPIFVGSVYAGYREIYPDFSDGPEAVRS